MSPSLGIELAAGFLSQYWDRDYGQHISDHFLVEEGLLPSDWEAERARVNRIIPVPTTDKVTDEEK